MSEQLVNEHFNDFPIDYFKVRPIDFESIIQTRGFESATQANEFINNFLENNPVSTIALNDVTLPLSFNFYYLLFRC